MNEFAFYMDVLHALEAVGTDYMVVGAFGASAYGLSRATHDADIIVDLDSAACGALAAHFPPPRYDADLQEMRDSIRLGIMFNIIDGSLGVKAGLVPLSREHAYREAFHRRVRCTVRQSISMRTVMKHAEARPLQNQTSPLNSMFNTAGVSNEHPPLALSWRTPQPIGKGPQQGLGDRPFPRRIPELHGHP